VAGIVQLFTSQGDGLFAEPADVLMLTGDHNRTVMCSSVVNSGAWKAPAFETASESGVWKTKDANPANMWYRIERGEKVEVVARFRGSRDVARTKPGLNSYWGGNIESRGIAIRCDEVICDPAAMPGKK
jgi:hypothetical protein